MGRTLSLPVSTLVLVLAGGLPATDPPPVAHDESGIAWDLQVQEDGTRSLRVGCRPGRRYTIEQSADLAEWTPVRSWTGLTATQVVSTDIFAGPAPADAPPASPPDPNAPPPMPKVAMLIVNPVDDGSAVLAWWRRAGDAPSCVKIHEPASSGSWGPPTMVDLHFMELDGWTVLLQTNDIVWKSTSPSLPPSDPPMTQDDSEFHALLLANRASIASVVEAIHANQQAALAEGRLRGYPAGGGSQGRFFRVREESGVDSDGDGLTDTEELALGLNILSNDTDGDGMPDAWEVANGLDARSDADAWGDADSDGRTNAEECLDETNPSNSDSDGDLVPDAEDAAPNDNAVDWRTTIDSSYAWIPIEGYVPATHGPPVSMNNKGQALFRNAIWSAGVWTMLNIEGGTYSIGDGESPAPSTLEALDAFDIDDSGRVLGWGELPDTVHGSGASLMPVVWTTPSVAPAIVGIAPGSNIGAGTGGIALTGGLPMGQSPEGWVCVSRFEDDPAGGSVTVFDWHAPTSLFSAPIPASPSFRSASGWPGFLFGGVSPGTRMLPGGSWAAKVDADGATPAHSLLLALLPSASGQPCFSNEQLPATLTNARTLGVIPRSALVQGQSPRPVLRTISGDVFIGHTAPQGASGHDWKISSSLAGAAAVSKSGEAIDGRNKAWRNRTWAKLDGFLPEGAKADNESLWTHDLNEDGVILASIGGTEGPPNAGDGSPASHVGLFIPIGVLAAPVVAAEGDSAGWLQGEADARPQVGLVIDSASLEGDEIVVALSGTVVHRISGMAGANEKKASQVGFRWAGGDLGSVPVTDVGCDPVAFQKQFRIPAGLATAYVIRAETDTNISGRTGWDEVAVSVQAFEHPQVFGSTPDTIRLSMAPDAADGLPRTVTVWFGDRAPAAEDGKVVETAAGARIFSGQATLAAGLRGASAKLALPSSLSATVADSFMGAVTVDVAGVGERTLHAWFQETGPATGIFAPRPGGEIVAGHSLEIADAEAMESSQGGAEPHPFSFRLVPRGFAPEGTEPELLVGGTAFALKPFTIGGKEFLFPVDPADESVPRQFLASRLPVPARMVVPGYAGGDQIEVKLLLGTMEFPLPPVWIEQAPQPEFTGSQASCLPLIDDFRGDFLPPRPDLCDGSPQPWRQPGDKITMPDLEMAFAFIYGEKGQILLEAFKDAGGTITLGNVLGDLDVEFFFFAASRAPEIQIEEDDPKVNGMPYHPGIAANLLWQGLVQSMSDYHVFEAIPAEWQVHFRESQRQAIAQQACRTTIAATNIYLSGICMTNDGLDLVMTINDLAEGHYEALAGALPFIPAAALRGGRLVLKKAGGEVLAAVDGAGLEAIQSFRRTDDLRTMGVKMDQHQFDECIRRVLTSNGGKIDVPTNPKRLRENMLAMGMEPTAEMVQKWGKVKRGDNWRSIAEAHHDFPWAEKKWFAEHGIDVNNPAFGRWVSTQDHSLFHTRTTDEYLEYWRDFIRGEAGFQAENGRPYGIAEILDKLAEARRLYPVLGVGS